MMTEFSSTGKYAYRAFGLVISSDICLPELIPAEGTSDIEIICDRVPSGIAKPTVKGVNYQVSSNELLFYINGVGHYYVQNGNRVVVQPEEHTDPAELKLYILGTAFGALLLQRGILPVHGSAVVIDGRCIIFTGASGAGKSTLSSALRKEGYSFLADDVSVVTWDEERIPWVQPAYPQQKLCRDSVKQMDEDTGALTLIDAEADKYALPARTEFLHTPVRLAAICELIPEDRCSAEMMRVSGAEKFNLLVRNIFRAQLISYFGLRAEYYRKCLDLARETDFYRLKRPSGIFSVDKQIKLVKECMELLSERKDSNNNIYAKRG